MPVSKSTLSNYQLLVPEKTHIFSCSVFFSPTPFCYPSFLVQCSMEQKASMVIYQNGIRVMYSACHTVRNINYLRVLNCLKCFFSELIILPIFSSSFNLFSHYYSHLLKQCSLMLICSTAIYQSGIRRLLKLWKTVSIPDLRIVTTLLHLPKITIVDFQ